MLCVSSMMLLAMLLVFWLSGSRSASAEDDGIGAPLACAAAPHPTPSPRGDGVRGELGVARGEGDLSPRGCGRGIMRLPRVNGAGAAAGHSPQPTNRGSHSISLAWPAARPAERISWV